MQIELGAYPADVLELSPVALIFVLAAVAAAVLVVLFSVLVVVAAVRAYRSRDDDAVP